ncbi:MAG TPA: hypothetical protein VM008_01900 [Phycisphaerae bacterium]|nr:hypothetical protein [Phycisphaerae bacterium]
MASSPSEPKNNPVYWGAVLAQAIRDGDAARSREAQRNLRRLGIPISVGTMPRGKAVARG